MESDSTSDVLSQAGLLLQDGKATSEMQRSIAKFAKLLICPLCNKVRRRKQCTGHGSQDVVFLLSCSPCLDGNTGTEPPIGTRTHSSLISRSFCLLIVPRLTLRWTCFVSRKIFDRPATLSACAHTFCMNCIDAYSCNHSTCPGEKKFARTSNETGVAC